MIKFTISDLILSLKDELNGDYIIDNENILIHNIVTDSRKIEKDDLFVPIKGENFDGHDFIEGSFEKGAVCALSERKDDNLKQNVIYVKSTKKALLKISEYIMEKLNIKTIAVTGSVGKTTTKDMIYSVVSQKYNALKTEGNFNNDIGLPLTVFRLTEENNAAILEMGMNNFSEIHVLSKVAKPDICVITNVGVAHIENLGSREGILKAKSEIFDFAKDDFKAVLNGDDDMLITLSDKLKSKVLWFGIENKNGVFADNIIDKKIFGMKAEIHTEKGSFKVNIPVPGYHNVLNALCATAVGILLDIDLDLIKKGIEDFTPGKMRMSVKKVNENLTVIDDVYNANPVSMKSSIDVLASCDGNKIAILGDMFELGKEEGMMHKEVGEYAAIKGIDTLICIGKISKEMYNGAIEKGHKNVLYFETQDEFLNESADKIDFKGTVLVKGSRGMKLEKTVSYLLEVK